MRVSTTNFQNAFGKYLKMAVEGEDVIVTKNGNGVAKLIGYEDPMVYVVNEGTNDYYIRKRVSYNEFLEITENSEARFELIDGELYMLASPKYIHQVVVREIFGQLYLWFKGKPCSPITAPFDIRLSNGAEDFLDDPNVVQPDILVICDTDKIDDRDNYQGIPTLIIEVLSHSTRSKDMVKKLNLYMNSGVNEYWVFDPDNKNVHIYIFKAKDIEVLHTYKFGESYKSSAFEGLVIDTSSLLV